MVTISLLLHSDLCIDKKHFADSVDLCRDLVATYDAFQGNRVRCLGVTNSASNMDVMKPDLMWIDGRCYRVNQNIGRSSEDSPFVEEDYNADYNEFESDEPCDEFEVETLEGGRCRTSFHVAKSFFPCIIGVKGSTRRRLENETKTQVKVPKQGQDGDIVVVGADAKSVRAARRRVNLIVAASRLKQPFTHFLSLPFNGYSIQEGFLKFKENVLAMPRARGVDPSIFQSPPKLHLTLCTLHLADGKERQEAGDALRSCAQHVIWPVLVAQGGALRVRLKGIEYMNDDPREVDVLYGKVEMASGDGTLLQRMADAVVQHFANLPGGYCEKQYDSVKLHVTLMNTLFREDAGGAAEGEGPRERGRHRVRESFDASAILQELRDFSFGEQTLEVLHLSQRYTTSSDGFYQASEVIALTNSP